MISRPKSGNQESYYSKKALVEAVSINSKEQMEADAKNRARLEREREIRLESARKRRQLEMIKQAAMEAEKKRIADTLESQKSKRDEYIQRVKSQLIDKRIIRPSSSLSSISAGSAHGKGSESENWSPIPPRPSNGSSEYSNSTSYTPKMPLATQSTKGNNVNTYDSNLKASKLENNLTNESRNSNEHASEQHNPRVGDIKSSARASHMHDSEASRDISYLRAAPTAPWYSNDTYRNSKGEIQPFPQAHPINDQPNNAQVAYTKRPNQWLQVSLEVNSDNKRNEMGFSEGSAFSSMNDLNFGDSLEDSEKLYRPFSGDRWKDDRKPISQIEMSSMQIKKSFRPSSPSTNLNSSVDRNPQNEVSSNSLFMDNDPLHSGSEDELQQSFASEQPSSEVPENERGATSALFDSLDLSLSASQASTLKKKVIHKNLRKLVVLASQENKAEEALSSPSTNSMSITTNFEQSGRPSGNDSFEDIAESSLERNERQIQELPARNEVSQLLNWDSPKSKHPIDARKALSPSPVQIGEPLPASLPSPSHSSPFDYSAPTVKTTKSLIPQPKQRASSARSVASTSSYLSYTSLNEQPSVRGWETPAAPTVSRVPQKNLGLEALKKSLRADDISVKSALPSLGSSQTLNTMKASILAAPPHSLAQPSARNPQPQVSSGMPGKIQQHSGSSQQQGGSPAPSQSSAGSRRPPLPATASSAFNKVGDESNVGTARLAFASVPKYLNQNPFLEGRNYHDSSSEPISDVQHFQLVPKFYNKDGTEIPLNQTTDSFDSRNASTPSFSDPRNFGPPISKLQENSRIYQNSEQYDSSHVLNSASNQLYANQSSINRVHSEMDSNHLQRMDIPPQNMTLSNPPSDRGRNYLRPATTNSHSYEHLHSQPPRAPLRMGSARSIASTNSDSQNGHQQPVSHPAEWGRGVETPEQRAKREALERRREYNEVLRKRREEDRHKRSVSSNNATNRPHSGKMEGRQHGSSAIPFIHNPFLPQARPMEQISFTKASVTSQYDHPVSILKKSQATNYSHSGNNSQYHSSSYPPQPYEPNRRYESQQVHSHNNFTQNLPYSHSQERIQTHAIVHEPISASTVVNYQSNRFKHHNPPPSSSGAQETPSFSSATRENNRLRNVKYIPTEETVDDLHLTMEEAAIQQALAELDSHLTRPVTSSVRNAQSLQHSAAVNSQLKGNGINSVSFANDNEGNTPLSSAVGRFVQKAHAQSPYSQQRLHPSSEFPADRNVQHNPESSSSHPDMNGTPARGRSLAEVVYRTRSIVTNPMVQHQSGIHTSRGSFDGAENTNYHPVSSSANYLERTMDIERAIDELSESFYQQKVSTMSHRNSQPHGGDFADAFSSHYEQLGGSARPHVPGSHSAAQNPHHHPSVYVPSSNFSGRPKHNPAPSLPSVRLRSSQAVLAARAQSAAQLHTNPNPAVKQNNDGARSEVTVVPVGGRPLTSAPPVKIGVEMLRST